jgi:hypothetical protein
MRRRLAIALSFVWLAAAPALADPPPAVTIDHIGAQLLYASTGAPSGDIAPPAKFSGWNTVIGEGDAKGPATDVLVSITLKTASQQMNLDTPLAVSARTAAGKVLAQRTFGHVLIDRGKAVVFLLLPDATCAGKVTITAALGRQTRSSTLALDCGE